MSTWAQEGLEEPPTLKVRKGGGEEIHLIQGKEQQLSLAGAAVKRYPTPKVRETQVSVVREHQRADTLKSYSQNTSQSNHTRTRVQFSSVAQSCPTLCDTMDSSLPDSSVHGILKARILKWFAIPFSSGPHSFRPLHHDPPVLGCPEGMA